MKKRQLCIQIFSASSDVICQDDFQLYVVFISNLFTFNLPAVEIKSTQKLLIELFDDENALFIFPNEKAERIYTIRENFPFLEFKNAPPAIKKKILIENVYQCLHKLYLHLELNPADVELAYKQIIDNDLQLSVQLCDGIKLNKKGIKASVTAEHFVDHALIRVVFLDIENAVINIVNLFKTVPAYIIYTQLISSSRWTNSEAFLISNNTKEFGIQININGDYNVCYNPKQRDVNGIKEEIQFLSTQVLIDIN